MAEPLEPRIVFEGSSVPGLKAVCAGCITARYARRTEQALYREQRRRMAAEDRVVALQRQCWRLRQALDRAIDHEQRLISDMRLAREED